MSAACSNQEKMCLIAAVAQSGFAISDITLYLDTHPQDQEALEYFHRMKHKYETACAEYESKVAPLRQLCGERQNGWQWADTPWPWERGYY